MRLCKKTGRVFCYAFTNPTRYDTIFFMRNIRQFGLVGHPLGHSLSPELHAFLFRKKNVSAEYRLCDLPALQPHLFPHSGFNVTLPYKTQILSFLQPSADAARFGAINTVVAGENGFYGYNTDASAFLRCTAGRLGKNVLLLGSGGLASALAVCILEQGCALTVAARTFGEKERALSTRLNEAFPGRVRFVSYADLEKEGTRYDALCNATSCGMSPVLGCPVSSSVVKRCGFVFDAVYNPLQTELLRLAEESGIPCENGVRMLALQATEAQKLWLGVEFSAEEEASAAALVQKLLSAGHVVLTGFSGCGKSTLAKQFYGEDLDVLTERMLGKSIAETFASDGEEAFRAAETQALERMLQGRTEVLALGGGTLERQKNRELLQRDIVVFVDTPWEECYRRIEGDVSRPLVCGKSKEELRLLYETRRKTYLAAADVVVKDDAAERILRLKTLCQTAKENGSASVGQKRETI